MKNLILVGGWVVAIALGALLISQQQKIASMDERLAAMGALETRLAESSAKIEALQKLPAPPEAKTPEAATPNSSSTPPEGHAAPDPVALLRGLFGAGGEDASPDADEPGALQKSMEEEAFKMFEGEDGQLMLNSMVDMTMNMQYAGLFSEMGLPLEKEEALRAALSDHLRAQMTMGMDAAKEGAGVDFDQIPTDEDLHAAVGEILSAEEMEAFTAYEEELPARMKRQEVETELGMFATGLSDEGRETAINVIVEHLVAADNAFMESDVVDIDFGQSEITAYTNALAQLELELSPDDVARVRRFVEHQQTQMEWMSRMMEDAEATVSVTHTVP